MRLLQKNNRIKRLSLFAIAAVSMFTFSLQPLASSALSDKEFSDEINESTWTMSDFSSSNNILFYDPNAGLSCDPSGGSDLNFDDAGGDVDKGLPEGWVAALSAAGFGSCERFGLDVVCERCFVGVFEIWIYVFLQLAEAWWEQCRLCIGQVCRIGWWLYGRVRSRIW